MAAFPIGLIALLCVVYKVLCPPILEKYEQYPCPNEKQEFLIVYKPKDLNISNCEQNWDYAERPIATLLNGDCSPPCLQVSPGELRLTECVSVTLTLLCSDPEGMVDEVRVHFHGNTSSSQGQRGREASQKEAINTQGQKNDNIGLCVSFGVIGAIGAGCIALILLQKVENYTKCLKLSSNGLTCRAAQTN